MYPRVLYVHNVINILFYEGILQKYGTRQLQFNAIHVGADTTSDPLL